jgi:hypothetical protein
LLKNHESSAIIPNPSAFAALTHNPGDAIAIAMTLNKQTVSAARCAPGTPDKPLPGPPPASSPPRPKNLRYNRIIDPRWMEEEQTVYCHKCGTEMPDDSIFCRKCGARLITDADLTPPTPLTPKEAYYQRLADVLTEAGFRTDPRLVEGSDAAASIKTMLQFESAFITLFVGPVSAIAGLAQPAVELITSWSAIDGEELYDELADIAPLFTLIAARYYTGKFYLLSTVDADGLSVAQMRAKAQALLDAAHRVGHPKLLDAEKSLKRRLLNVNIDTFCLYIFFDDREAARHTDAILKQGRLRKPTFPLQEAQTTVWPIVVNVPARETSLKNPLLKVFFKTGGMPITEAMLKKTFR